MPEGECEVEHRLQIERSIPNTGGKSLVGKFLPGAGKWFVIMHMTTQANGDPATSKGSTAVTTQCPCHGQSELQFWHRHEHLS